MVLSGVRAGVPGPQLPRQRFAGLIAVGEQRVKPVAALEVPGRALLLRVRSDQRGVQVDRQTLRPASELPHTSPRCGVSGTQPLKALWVTRDPIDHSKRRRAGGDVTEQRLLVTNRTQISQTLPAIGEHHRKITNHTAQVVAGAPLLQTRQLKRERPRQTRLISNPCQQRAARMRDQTLSVRRDNYLEIAAIMMHPQGDPPELGNRTFSKPNSPSPAGHPRAPDHPRRVPLMQDPGKSLTNRRTTSAPPPGALRACARTPYLSATLRTIDRPRPE